MPAPRHRSRPSAPAVPPKLAPGVAGREQVLLDLRLRLQDEVVGAFDALLDVSDAADLRARVAGIVERVIGLSQIGVTRDERLRLIDEVINEIAGLGPLEPLLADDTITEIMVNGPKQIYIERRGKIQRVDSAFMSDEHVLRIIDRIIAPLGRRIDESSPRVDARLPDGSRVNVIIEPLSLVGPVITIRKFAARPFTVDDLIGFGTATAEMFDFLKACVEGRLNIFVSGGTGSGKTTFLNVLSSFIPNDERIITVEDAAELQLRQDHVVTLEARPPNLEGEGEITIRDLMRNALHMRPDRIIVGECRAGEALDMLQAMNSGQDGSLSTGHANTPPDMLRRLETMVLMTGYELPLRAIREQIASAVDVIVHTARLKDGSRKVVNITEVYGLEDDEILTQDIFAFEQTGVRRRKDRGAARPDRSPADVHAEVQGQRDHAAARGIRHPRRRSRATWAAPQGKMGRWRDGSADRSVPTARRHRTGGHGRRHGLRLVDRARRSRYRSGRQRRDQGADPPVPAQPEGEARGRGKLAGQGRLGELVAARPVGVRRLQRGMGALVPRRHADRPGDPDASAAAPRRFPRIDRGDRRGAGARAPGRRSDTHARGDQSGTSAGRPGPQHGKGLSLRRR